MDEYILLDEAAWRRLTKSRKQAIEVMHATTELVMRRFVGNVIEKGGHVKNE